MDKQVLIYGAYGYTGQLIVDEALEKGITPILAGRSANKLEPYAAEKGLEHRVFGLDSESEIDAGLEGIHTVIHCAGPFFRTAEAMAKGCIRNQANYLDITGEISVFLLMHELDADAKAAGVMLMSGTGFDIVPTDCLGMHLKEKLPSATHLTLAFHTEGSTSHGTTSTIVEGLHKGGMIRENGELKSIPLGGRTMDVDFGKGLFTCMTIQWGDVATAYFSTGIPNTIVYTSAVPKLRRFIKICRYLRPILSMRVVIDYLTSKIPEGGPDKVTRDSHSSLLWGEVRDGEGNVAQARLKTPEGYNLTAMASVNIAQRCLAGEAPAGFWTPAGAFGSGLVLEVPGVEGFEDL